MNANLMIKLKMALPLEGNIMQYPKITIITPSFNQGKYIKQTIDSVLDQNYPNLEYWIIDGGSMDETIEILNSYGNQINWISENDNGQAHAINKGFHLATGEIVAFLNSDDFYLPGALEKVVGLFQEMDCKWITGNYIIVNENNQRIQSFIPIYKQFLQHFSSRFMLSITNYINQPSTFWRREAFDKIGYFNENLNYTMDYDFWMRLSKYCPLQMTPAPLSGFRIHTNSKGGSQFVAQFEEEFKVLKRNNSNRFLWLLHKIHNALIILLYRIIK
jgi:glycosyltransferase involved in cell wall biosynthesis